MKSAVFQSQEQLQEAINNQLKRFKASSFKAVRFTEERYVEAYYGKSPTTFDEFIKRLMDQNRVLRSYVEIATRCGYSYTENIRSDKSSDDKDIYSQERYKATGPKKPFKSSSELAPVTGATKPPPPKSRCFNCGEQGRMSINCPQPQTEATKAKRASAAAIENKHPNE